MLKRFGGIAVAIIIGLAIWGFQTYQAKSNAPEVGECVTVSGSLSDLDVEEATCGDDDVLFKVVGDDGNCDQIENEYTHTINGKEAVNLCLFPEVVKGDCIDIGGDDEMESKVACADSQGNSNVLKVLKADYTTASAGCSKRALELQNTTRGATICLGPNA